MLKVIATDGMASDGVEIFEKADGIELEVRKGVDADELLKIIPEYDGIIIRSATKVTEEVLAAGKKLKAVGRAGVGVDNVDIKSASRRGIVVMNTPQANTISTAEHTIAMIFSLARRIPEADAYMKKGEWAKKKLKGVELYGKTLGVVGYGRIGRWVAKVCQSVGMKIVAFDPMVSDDKIRETDATPATVEELFKISDFITVHTPVNNETRNMINKDTIAIMKDGVRLVNCARGGIINEDDLCDAVESGKVAGAALDVYPKEPNQNKRLETYSQIILTPHIAASTGEAQSKVGVEVAEEMVEYLVNGAISNAINATAMGEEERKQILPFVEFGSRLGSILAQVACGDVKSLRIVCEGTLNNVDITPITRSIISGVLSYNVEGVNQVNAELMAEEQGLKIEKIKSSNIKGYTNFIRVEAINEKGEMNSVGGTIFGEKNQHPRIVRINDFHVDVIPEGFLLILVHKDAPGIIGKVGTIIGDANINICRMTCDSLKPGEVNVGAFGINKSIGEDVLERIKNTEGVMQAHCVSL
ncbi:MAG: phosphoglycerate dehydrogenase [Chlamydiae bacterium]|nr:MAG: phosphoglycerate dehydrogenase [Chlamydiota bacterium]